MYSISVIEDSDSDREILNEHLRRYSEEKGVPFGVENFADAENFLTVYAGGSDIVFMDIDLPGMDGMRGAEKLREMDSRTVLIFVTNMAQFAVKGYEVEALDYIVKPVVYNSFRLKMDRAIRAVERDESDYVSLVYERCFRKINLSDLLYVEVRGHRLFYHLADGEVLDVRGTMESVEETLGPKGFARCNSCYVVNMRYVTEISADDVVVGKESLQISRRRRTELVEAYSRYLSERTPR